MSGPRTAALRSASQVPPELLAGLARGRARLNRAAYWASHEAFETAWGRAEGEDRRAIKGLIKAGAAFHKLLVQNRPAGARYLLEQALDHLQPWPEAHLGLALRPFTAQLRMWLERLDAAAASTGSIVGLPRLDWTPESEHEALEIDAVELHQIELGGRRAVLLRVQAGSDEGWGEGLEPWGHQGLWESLQRSLVPALLTERIVHPAELPELAQDLSDDARAEAALELAVWDLWSRRRGLGLCEAMGHEPRPIELAGRARQLDPTRLQREIELLCTAGYRHLVLPARPNADRRSLPEQIAGLDRPWSVDLGRAYGRADVQALEALARLGPRWMADPVPAWDLSGAERLRRWLAPPLARSGWLRSAELSGARRLGLMDLALVDPLVSGIARALAMAEQAEELGLGMGLRTRALTPVGAAAALAWAAHPSLTLPADLGAVEGFDGRPHALPDADGRHLPAAGPGLGLRPPDDWLDAHRRRRWRIEA